MSAEQFAAFEAALYEANKVKNLTGVPREECRVRHFEDSLLVAEFIPEGSSVLDIGTGPGFPSWPLACARPDLQVTAIDSNGKMLAFLKSQPLPNLVAVNARAEEWGRREHFDFVTGRAVAPFPVQAELSAWHVRVGGLFVPLRTQNDHSAIEQFPASQLGLELESLVTKVLPGIEVPRLFPVFRKVRLTPLKYPRAWAEMKRWPLGSLPLE
jgi:16S rRNA (guanine527-N7)-methyltransferase